MPDDGPFGDPSPGYNKSNNPSDNSVERTRSWSGLWVVMAGDAAIAVGAATAAWRLAQSGASASTLVAILTSAFTAVSTMTTAYFGIKTTRDAAQAFAPALHAAVNAAAGLAASGLSPGGPGPSASGNPAGPQNAGPGSQPGDQTEEPAQPYPAQAPEPSA
ncbi:MAG TPA: hypothetical protein VGI58_13710 [Streptosporangiaceae bacterium]